MLPTDPGVYGTKLPPSTPIFRVLTNNYDADGGVTGRGEDVMDRADYVIGFDVSDDDIVKVINDVETRFVVIYGGGGEVSLGEAVAHGRAAEVAKLEEADERLKAMGEDVYCDFESFINEKKAKWLNMLNYIAELRNVPAIHAKALKQNS